MSQDNPVDPASQLTSDPPLPASPRDEIGAAADTLFPLPPSASTAAFSSSVSASSLPIVAASALSPPIIQERRLSRPSSASVSGRTSISRPVSPFHRLSLSLAPLASALAIPSNPLSPNTSDALHGPPPQDLTHPHPTTAEAPLDERQRGEALNPLPSAPTPLTIAVVGASGASPSTAGEAIASPKEVAAAEEVAPSGCTAVVSGVISSLIFTVLYLPFTVAILTQSAIQGRPIQPKDWQTELTTPYWLFSFSLFAFLFFFPFVLVFGLMTDSGLWSIFDNNVASAIPFTVFLALYLSLFVGLHLTTVYYAYLRPDLRVVHSKYHQFHLHPSHVLATAAIIFEAFQLISPWLTNQSLGLHDTGSGGQYKAWLENSAKVFGIGSWQVVSINTYLETFWTAFSIVVVYAVALGYGIYSNMQPDHWLSGVLFELIPGTFYLSIIARLFSVFNCEATGDGGYTLQGNTDIECWDNSFHRSLCMAAFMGLLFYSSSAMFVACYRGDASGNTKGVKFKPLYLVMERTLRDLFAMTATLISDQTLSRSLSYPILVALVTCTWYMQPCSVPSLNRLKMLSQGSAVWLLSLTFLADIFRSTTSWFDSYVPALLLYGWYAGVALYVANEGYWWWGRQKRKETRRASIVASGLSRHLPSRAIAEDDEDDDIRPLPSPLTSQQGNNPPFSLPSPTTPAAMAVNSEEKPAVSTPLRMSVSASQSGVSAKSSAMGDGVVPWSASRGASPVLLRGALNIRAQAIKHSSGAQSALAAEQTQTELVPGVLCESSVSTS